MKRKTYVPGPIGAPRHRMKKEPKPKLSAKLSTRMTEEEFAALADCSGLLGIKPNELNRAILREYLKPYVERQLAIRAQWEAAVKKKHGFKNH
jgi:hypothetical protein